MMKKKYVPSKKGTSHMGTSHLGKTRKKMKGKRGGKKR